MLRRGSTHTIESDPTIERDVVVERDDALVGDHDHAVRPLAPPSPHDRVLVDPAPVAHADRTALDDRRAVEARVARQRFSLASVLAAVGGVALLVIGIIALLRGGVDGPIDEPVVQVLGFAHTPLLGIIDIGMGVALVLAAASSNRLEHSRSSV